MVCMYLETILWQCRLEHDDFVKPIKLSLISTRISVGSWLFCIRNFPCLISYGACLELVWRCKQLTFLNGFIGNQARCNTFWLVKLSLVLDEQNIEFFGWELAPTPSMHQKLTEHGMFCTQNNQILTQTMVKLQDQSNVLKLLLRSRKPNNLHD